MSKRILKKDQAKRDLLEEAWYIALEGLRMWPIRGFEKILVFYRPIRGGIEVIRVLHGARDVEEIFEGE